MRRLSFSLCVLFTLLVAQSSFAQVGRMRYPFSSRDQVIPTLQQTRGNLRETYNALICAARLGYINTAIGYYEGLMSGHEFDASAQDSAAYAFAYDLGSSVRPWDWRKDLDRGGIRRSSRAVALLFRDRAFAALPKSPEVLVMRAFWQTAQDHDFRRQGYFTDLQAVKLAPKWSDAYYWLAWSAHNYGLALQQDVWPVLKNPASKATRIRLGKKEMRAYDMAEKLDPSLRPYLYLLRAGACELIADKKSAQMIPVYVNAHLRAFPRYIQWYQHQTGQGEVEFRASYRQIADDIAKHATS